MHPQPRQIPVQFHATRWAVGLLLVGAAQLPAIAMSESTPPAIVGEATMVIGTARITSALGQSVVADKGAAIRVGDRIETEASGHVHLRFVDGGRVSVRTQVIFFPYVKIMILPAKSRYSLCVVMT